MDRRQSTSFSLMVIGRATVFLSASSLRIDSDTRSLSISWNQASYSGDPGCASSFLSDLSARPDAMTIMATTAPAKNHPQLITRTPPALHNIGDLDPVPPQKIAKLDWRSGPLRRRRPPSRRRPCRSSTRRWQGTASVWPLPPACRSGRAVCRRPLADRCVRRSRAFARAMRSSAYLLALGSPYFRGFSIRLLDRCRARHADHRVLGYRIRRQVRCCPDA